MSPDDACEACRHLIAVTPRPGIQDGRYCAMTSCRATPAKCIYRHMPAHAAGLTVLRGSMTETTMEVRHG